MSVNPSSMQTHQSFSEFLSTHQGLVIGGGVVLALVLGGIMLRGKQQTVPTTTTGGDLTGLTGGRVYVPTSTSFTTENIKYGPQSNDPNLTTITNSPVNSNNPTTTTTNTTTNNDLDKNPIRVPPPPVPAPRPTSKGLIWDKRYSIRGGETLSSIAASLTRTLRAQGMPGSMTLTWHDLYGHNTDLINRTAQAHGFRSDYYNWIFPGENITIPRWG